MVFILIGSLFCFKDFCEVFSRGRGGLDPRCHSLKVETTLSLAAFRDGSVLQKHVPPKCLMKLKDGYRKHIKWDLQDRYEGNMAGKNQLYIGYFASYFFDIIY